MADTVDLKMRLLHEQVTQGIDHVKRVLKDFDHSSSTQHIRGELGGVEKAAHAAGHEIRTVIEIMGAGSLIAGGGVIATITGVGKALGDFGREALVAATKAEDLGTSVAEMKRFQLAGEALGMSTEEAAASVQRIMENLQNMRGRGFSQVWQTITTQMVGGFDLAEALRLAVNKGGVKAGFDQFVATMHEWAQSGNLTAMRFLTETLGAGSSAWAHVGDLVEKFGHIVEVNVEDAKKFRFESVKLGAELEHLKVNVGNELLPVFSDLFKMFREWMATSAGHTFQEQVVALARSLKDLPWAEIATTVSVTVKEIMAELGPVITAIAFVSKNGVMSRETARAAWDWAQNGSPMGPAVTELRRSTAGLLGDKLSLPSISPDAVYSALHPNALSNAVRVRPDGGTFLQRIMKFLVDPASQLNKGDDAVRVQRQSYQSTEDLAVETKKLSHELRTLNDRIGSDPSAAGVGGADGVRAGGRNVTNFRKGVRMSGSGAGGPVGPATGALKDRIGEVKTAFIKQLREEGVPEGNLEEAANLLTGQAIAESGINPRQSHDQGTGYGIYGARLDRRSAMLNWMKEKGFAPDSLEGQGRYMAHEAMSGRYRRTKDALMGAQRSTRDAATDTLTREFESPAVINRRGGFVGQAADVPAGSAAPPPAAAPASQPSVPYIGSGTFNPSTGEPFATEQDWRQRKRVNAMISRTAMMSTQRSRAEINVSVKPVTNSDVEAGGGEGKLFNPIKLARTPQLPNTGGDRTEWSRYNYE